MKIKINFYLYSLLLIFMFNGDKFFIPLSVLSIILLFSNRLFYKKINIDIDFVLLTIFTIFYPLRLISDASINLSSFDIVEWKTYVVLLILGFLSLDIKDNSNKQNLLNINNFIGSNFSLAIFSFSIISFYYTAPSIFRFPDYSPVATHMISIYFGFLCLLGTSLVRNILIKILLLTLSLIAGGGTTILAVIVYFLFYVIFNENIPVKKKLIMFVTSLLISIFIFVPIFIFSQDKRGRDLTDFKNIDRYIGFDFGVRYIRDNYTGLDLLVGKGPDENLEFENFLENYSLTLGETFITTYIVNENPEVSGKNFHNDFLRIFIHYGLFGVLVFIRYTYKLFSYDVSFYIAFLVMSFSNSISTISFTASMIIVIFLLRNGTLLLKNYKKYI